MCLFMIQLELNCIFIWFIMINYGLSWENTMKKVSVQDFINANPKAQGQSKLTPFKDDIIFLKNQGYTGKQILTFLAQNDVVISPNALNVFIRKNINVSMTTPNNQTELPKPNDTNQNHILNHSKPQETIENQAETTQKNKPKKGIKKFDWQSATTDGLV